MNCPHHYVKPCKACQGTGRQSSWQCKVCDGKGKLCTNCGKPA